MDCGRLVALPRLRWRSTSDGWWHYPAWFPVWWFDPVGDWSWVDDVVVAVVEAVVEIAWDVPE